MVLVYVAKDMKPRPQFWEARAKRFASNTKAVGNFVKDLMRRAVGQPGRKSVSGTANLKRNRSYKMSVFGNFATNSSMIEGCQKRGKAISSDMITICILTPIVIECPVEKIGRPLLKIDQEHHIQTQL